MHIHYDHQMFSIQAIGGITRIFVELMRRLPGRLDCAVSWFRGFHIDEYGCDEWVARLSRYQSFSCSGVPLTPAMRAELNWKALETFLSTTSGEGEIYHPTYHEGRALEVVGKRKLVVTVADLIAEKYFGGLERFAQHLAERRQIIERADLILVISECTRRDLIEIHGVPAEKIRLTYLASDFDTLDSIPVPAAVIRRGRPYFLWVGTRSKYKNFDEVLRAFAASPELRRDFDVVVFGGTSGYLQHELEFMERHGMRSNFLYERGDDRALKGLYESAVGLVYTSRYEGFGLPPLEAMHCRCPVICCGTGSLPEVVGDAAEVVSPDDPGQLAATMLRIAGDPGLRQRLALAGLERATLFTWQKTADDTFAAYKSAVE